MDLRREFTKAFGNEGLRSGTTVLKAGQPARPVAVSSWGQLLPSISRDLDIAFNEQPRVRCGTFNEWQDGSGSHWKKIENIVEAILKFDEKPEYQNEFLNFNDSSQEGAVIDGVLVENGFFTHNPMAAKWELISPTTETPCEVLREALRYLAARSIENKPFVKLHEKLIEPPYGVPNGVIPLFLALVFRTEPARIAIYHKKYNNWERVESRLAEAIVGMGRFPDRYQTRYSKLSPKQRWMFRVIGSELAIIVPQGGPVEKMEEACEKVAGELRDFGHKLPDAAIAIPDLTETEKDILKALRGGVPPQPTLLADHLMRWVQQDAEASREFEDAGSTLTAFPGTLRLWRGFRERLGRQVEGARAPVRRQLLNAGNDLPGIVESLRKVELIAGYDNSVLAPIVERLEASDGKAELIEEVVAAISNKETRQLTQEDYGRASGILQVLQSLTPQRGRMTVILPSGGRRELPDFAHEPVCVQMRESVRAWRDVHALSPEQTAALLLGVVFSDSVPSSETTEAIVDQSYFTPKSTS